MLSIMVFAYRGKSAHELPEIDDIETERMHLLSVYIQRMFDRRKSSEQTYTVAETRHYLAWLAQKMQEHTLSVFQIEQMQPTWLSSERRQHYYRMLQLVYLPFNLLFYGLSCFIAAYFIGVPPWLLGPLVGLAVVISSWAFNNDKVKNWRDAMVHSFIFALAWGLSFAVGYGVFNGVIIGILWFTATQFSAVETARFYTQRGMSRNNIVVVELLRFSRKNIVLSSGIVGFIVGMLGVFIYGFVFGAAISPVQAAVGIIAGGIVNSLFAIYHSGLTGGEVEFHSQPNQGMRATFASAVSGALVVVLNQLLQGLLGYVVVSSLAYGLGLGFAVCFTAGCFYFNTYGGFAIFQHIALRQVLHQDNFIPQNYARFLDYAASLILLRKVGGGYIFIHRYLLEYFAELDETG
jgi:eukaryotic-like serine/threonine-protein kinase